MQLLNHWPSESDISLPEKVKCALLAHLLEPFEDIESAKAFWHDYPSMIIIVKPNDPIESIQWLNKILQQQVKFALSNSDLSDVLPLGFTIKLSITSDAGNGLYVITPAESFLLNVSEDTLKDIVKESSDD